jgi:ABC-2 type transport system ATP-binding protein
MESAANQYAIETINLKKVFPDWWGRARVKAVIDLNLKVRYNEIYGFLGPNGSGKTTTIKMLLNLLHPSGGHAFVLGGKSTDAAISRRIGYLPEESYLYRYLTARETLDFYGRIFGLPGPVRKSRIDTLLEMVGLSGMGNRQIGTFSKGMMRRIGLAQALINDPDLLILDEPTSGLDPMGTRQIKDLLAELGRRGKTILLSSHLLADVEDVCDRIGILYGGRMQVEGPVRELLQHRGEVQILAGNLKPQTREKIEALLREEGSTYQISSPMDKLETFFVNTVIRAQETQPTSGARAGTGIQGFLAAEPKSPQQEVLSRLVSTAVHPEAKPLGDTHTEKPQVAQVPPAVPAAKKELLTKLAQTPMTAGEAESPITEKPTAVPPKPAAPIRKDLLEELTGRDKGPDGRTEKTEGSGPGGLSDA